MIVSVIGALAPVIALAVDEAEAEAAARALADKLSVTVSDSAFEARAVTDPIDLTTQYICTDGAHMFVLSGTYQLMAYRNLERAKGIRKGVGPSGGQALSNQSAAVAAAKALAQRLGYDPSRLFVGKYEQHADDAAANVNMRGRAFIQLEHRPGGYSALGISGCSITLDTQDGTVVTLVRYFSWRLGPPDAQISEDDAVALARQTLAAHEPQIDGDVAATPFEVRSAKRRPRFELWCALQARADSQARLRDRLRRLCCVDRRPARGVHRWLRIPARIGAFS